MKHRIVPVAAGERTMVLHMPSDSLAQKVEFEVETPDGSVPDGVVEVEARRFLVQKTASQHPLLPLNKFQKAWSESPYSIHVTSSTDAMVRFRTRHVTDKVLYLVLATVLLFGLLAMSIPLLLR